MVRSVAEEVVTEAGSVAPPRVSYMVARVERLLRVRLGEVLAPHDLTLAEYTALSILGRRSGLTNAQLARRTYISPQAMQQVLERLVARGLITRTPHQTKGRVLPATLTDRGRRLLGACDEDVDELEEQMMGGLTPGGRQILLESLFACVEGLTTPAQTRSD